MPALSPDVEAAALAAPLRRPLASLRPWLWALGWLLLIDLGLRALLPPDPRTLRQPLRAHACMADAALDALVDLRRLGDVSDSAGPPVDVVLLGDSVLGSVENPAGERLHDYLAQHLAARGISTRIHNLSAGGAHAADQYAALLRLHRRLRDQPMALRNLIVVLSVNPIFFSRRHSQPSALYPCLFEELSDEDLEGSARADALRRRLGVPRPAPPYEHALAQRVARTWYLYQQRRRLGESFFAATDALRSRLRRAAPGPDATAQTSDAQPTHSNRPWFQQGLTADHYASSYDLLPFSDASAHNAQVTALLADWLRRHPALAVLVEQVPQNHFLMASHTQRPSYVGWAQQTAALFQQAKLPYRSHDGDPALSSEKFQDLDHLTASGNDTLAAWIADDLMQLMRRSDASTIGSPRPDPAPVLPQRTHDP